MSQYKNNVYEAIVLKEYLCDLATNLSSPLKTTKGQKVIVLKQDSNGWSFIVPFDYGGEYDPHMVPRGWVPTAYLSENPILLKENQRSSMSAPTGSRFIRMFDNSSSTVVGKKNNNITDYEQSYSIAEENSNDQSQKDQTESEKNSISTKKRVPPPPKPKIQKPPPPPPRSLIEANPEIMDNESDQIMINLSGIKLQNGIIQNWPVFKSDLITLCKKTERNFPLLCYSCLVVVLKSGLNEEGIFRISPRKVELESVKEQVDKDEINSLQIIDKNDHDLAAGLFKLYLRELPSGIMENDLYHARSYSVLSNLLKIYKSNEMNSYISRYSPSCVILNEKLRDTQKILSRLIAKALNLKNRIEIQLLEAKKIIDKKDEGLTQDQIIELNNMEDEGEIDSENVIESSRMFWRSCYQTFESLMNKVTKFSDFATKHATYLVSLIQLLTNKYKIMEFTYGTHSEIDEQSKELNEKKIISMFSDILLTKASAAIILSNCFYNFIFMQHTFHCFNKVHENRDVNLMTSANLATILGGYILYENKDFPDSDLAKDTQDCLYETFPFDPKIQVGSMLVKHFSETWNKIAYFLPETLPISMRRPEVIKTIENVHNKTLFSEQIAFSFLSKVINVIYNPECTQEDFYNIIIDEFDLDRYLSLLSGITNIPEENKENLKPADILEAFDKEFVSVCKCADDFSKIYDEEIIRQAGLVNTINNTNNEINYENISNNLDVNEEDSNDNSMRKLNEEINILKIENGDNEIVTKNEIEKETSNSEFSCGEDYIRQIEDKKAEKKIDEIDLRQLDKKIEFSNAKKDKEIEKFNPNFDSTNANTNESSHETEELEEDIDIDINEEENEIEEISVISRNPEEVENKIDYKINENNNLVNEIEIYIESNKYNDDNNENINNKGANEKDSTSEIEDLSNDDEIYIEKNALENNIETINKIETDNEQNNELCNESLPPLIIKTLIRDNNSDDDDQKTDIDSYFNEIEPIQPKMSYDTIRRGNIKNFDESSGSEF